MSGPKKLDVWRFNEKKEGNMAKMVATTWRPNGAAPPNCIAFSVGPCVVPKTRCHETGLGRSVSGAIQWLRKTACRPNGAGSLVVLGTCKSHPPSRPRHPTRQRRAQGMPNGGPDKSGIHRTKQENVVLKIFRRLRRASFATKWWRPMELKTQ